LFEVGREVLAFTDFDELVDHATRLLNETGLAARLGDAAAQRAHQEHTYDVRLATALQALL
jgi:spore maturation protein CgeB